MLFKYQGHIGAALVLGGVDCTGPGLYQIYPHGSTSKLPYVTMGSGSLAAMSVFETEYKDGMDEAGAVALRAGQESEIPNFKGSFLGRFPLVSADFWTSDHLSERSRSVDVFLVTRARGTLTLKRR